MQSRKRELFLEIKTTAVFDSVRGTTIGWKNQEFRKIEIDILLYLPQVAKKSQGDFILKKTHRFCT